MTSGAIQVKNSKAITKMKELSSVSNGKKGNNPRLPLSIFFFLIANTVQVTRH